MGEFSQLGAYWFGVWFKGLGFKLCGSEFRAEGL